MSLATRRTGSSFRTGGSTSEPLNPTTLPGVLDLLRRLDAARLSYRLEQIRDDAICIQVAVPGERWEIELLETGEVEIEVFQSNGEIRDAHALSDLFARFSD